jgi:hypothetical protein
LTEETRSSTKFINWLYEWSYILVIQNLRDFGLRNSLRWGDYFILVKIINVVPKLGITDLLLLDVNTVNCFGRLEYIYYKFYFGKD